MHRLWRSIPFLGLVVIIATGCVRSAGNNAFVPVDPGVGMTASSTPLPPEPESTPTALDASAQSEDIATPTEAGIALTVVVPTETALPLLEVTSTATNTEIATSTLIPTSTSLPMVPTSTPLTVEALPTLADANAQALQAPTSSVPTGPSGPVMIATNTPIPSPTPIPTVGAQSATGAESTTEDTAGTSESAVQPASSDDDTCTYTVQRGDNAFRIAVNNNITLRELQVANPSLTGSNPVIFPGDVLSIPGCGEGTSPRQTSTPTPAPTSATGETPAEDGTPVPDGFTVYVVRSGDTLSQIARNNGTTISAIVAANNIANPDRLSVGTELLIPQAATPTPAATATAAVGG